MAVCLKGTRTFRILCKKAKHCGDNEDVARIVRDYIIVSFSQMSDLFWRFVTPQLSTSYPFTCRRHACVGWVDPAILAEFEHGEEDERRERLGYLNDDLNISHALRLENEIAGERDRNRYCLSV